MFCNCTFQNLPANNEALSWLSTYGVATRLLRIRLESAAFAFYNDLSKGRFETTLARYPGETSDEQVNGLKFPRKLR